MVDDIQIPKEVFDNQFTPIKADAGGETGEGKTTEQIAAEEEAKRVAAANATGEGTGDPPPPDPSLLSAADPKLVTSLEGLLTKEDGTLTEDEEKVLEDNLELVRSIANKEVPFVQQLMSEENLVQEGDFEDTYDGRVSYLKARDAVRDKVNIDNYFAQNPGLQQFKEHVIDNKLPVSTFLAQVNRPAVLDTEIRDVTETMGDDEKANLESINEQIVRANLKATGVDIATQTAIIEGAKTAGTLRNLALSSQANMKNIYETEIKRVNDQTIAQQNAAKGARDAEDLEVTNLIKSGKLTDSFTIPKTDEVTFGQYMVTPINDRGQTMADLKYSKLTLGERAVLDYIVFKEMKLPSVAKTNVMSRFKVGNKQNQKRQTKVKVSGGGPSLSTLDFVAMAKERNII